MTNSLLPTGPIEKALIERAVQNSAFAAKYCQPTEREALTAARREYWMSVLAQAGDNVTEAARIAGVHRSTVWKRVKQCGLTPLNAPLHHGAWESVDDHATAD